MTLRAITRNALLRLLLIVLSLFQTALAIGQEQPFRFGLVNPPQLVMVARDDPADPSRYIGVFGADLSDSVAIYRNGRRLNTTVPQELRRGDEIATSLDVVAVIRFPVGDVYIDRASRVRIGSLDVLFGKIFARVRGIFSVENQNVVAGVEGTEFAFEVNGEGAMQVTVLEGTVVCSSKTQPWQPVRVLPGREFGVTANGRELRIGDASPASLAQLQTWVRRVDAAAAATAPPPPPPPPTTPPPPRPTETTPPAPTPGGGYCCAAGQLNPSSVQECRGTFYYDLDRAKAACGFAQPPPPVVVPVPVPVPFPTPRPPDSPQGYCCANGDVYASTRDRCRGNFYFDQVSARRSCPAPAPTRGYCCASGQVMQTTRNQCPGNFFNDEASARKSCTAPPQQQPGYCCIAGDISRTNRDQCRGGKYFADAASAKSGCVRPPAPEQGYCCAGGKVSATTRDRCGGTFARTQAEAQRACTVIEKGGVIEPAKPKSDVLKKEGGIIQRLPDAQKPPDGPVVR